MLITFRLGSFPAEYKTMTSVPPAMGSHCAGSAASRERAPCRLPGETSLYSDGSALIAQLFGAPPWPLLRKSACSQCSDKDFRQDLRVCPSTQAAVFFRASARRQESFPACKCRTARRRIPGTTPAEASSTREPPFLDGNDARTVC